MDPMAETDRWLGELGPELGLPSEVLSQVKGPLLDLVRDVAHGVARPAGPLTAFLVGLAAGLATPGGDASASAPAALDRIERVNALTARWVPQED
jgi:hypothetical protein